MKVCILTATSEWGGTEVHTIGLAEMLKTRCHEVEIVQLGHNLYEERIDGATKIRLRRIEIPKPLECLSITDWYLALRPISADICVFEKGHLDAGSWRLDLVARIRFQSYITIEQALYESLPPRSTKRYVHGLLPGFWWHRAYLGTYLRKHLRSLTPHRIVCASDAIKNRLTESYGFPSRKLITIHDGIDADKFQRDAKAREAMRAAWGIREKCLVFGAVGRLDIVKGYNTAIKLFGELTSTIPNRDIRLVLVGQGPLYDDLKRAANEAGLTNRVILTGFIERNWEAYSAFDVFILPSLTEGLPLALLEAMACGCCTVAMGVGGVPEVLTDPSFGWLVPPGDQRGFLAALRDGARSDHARLIEMGKKARQHVISRFNGRVQFSKLAELIESGMRTPSQFRSMESPTV